MKKLLLLITALLIFSENNRAQSNGVTSYTCTIGTNNNNFAFRSALAIDNNGNKWVGFNFPSTLSYQLVRYNGTTWDSFPVIPGKRVNALAVDAANNLWIGTDSGLVMYNGSVFTKYNRSNSNIPSDTVNCIATGGGKIYAGTNHGLAIFNGTTFTNYNHTQNGLSHDTIYSIAYESPTAVWLGNIGGLEKFYGLGFTYWYSLGGVGSDKINCIYIDQQNNKWLGTNTHGVVKFDNLNFYTMQQLYGQYAIVGGAWPTQTNSICRGPNGGVSFVLLSMNSNTPNSQGLIEILNNNSTYVYDGVGYTTTSYSTNYSIFQYDASSNKLFFVNTGGAFTPKVFLYSFNLNQYTNNPFPIQTNNSAYLDINNVSALISSDDNMGWDGSDTKYFVPKTANSSPLHNSALWIGGYNNGMLHTAAMTYRQNGMDFWPGPLDTIHDSIDVNTANAFNKVWKVNRYDIANYIYNWQHGNVQNGTYIPANSILTWPGNGTGSYAHNLAPYVDVNSNGIYDPIHDGDYPLIKGDQMIWRVFNDAYSTHRESGGGALGVEVQASAYAFVCPNIADSNRVLNYTTFYNYKIINRSANEYDSCIIANWVDSDLGNYLDDYVGCDVMNNYGYAYNGDDYDEDANGMTGYHANLPAFACNILNGPFANPNDGKDNNNNGIIDEPNEKCLMTSFNYYTNTGDLQTGNPTGQVAIQYYNFMNGKWRNGTPMTDGSNGTVSSSYNVCRHLFPGNTDPYGISMGGSIANPIAPSVNYGAPGWTQYTAQVVKNDMRFMTGTGPFTMYAGGIYEFDYAYVFSQDSTNCYGDTAAQAETCVLPRAQQDNIRVRNWFNANNFPSCLSLNGVGIQQNVLPQLEVSVYPNPASNYLYIEFKDAKEKTTIEVFDLLGNIVKAGTFNDAQKYISIPVDDLQNGMYSVRIKTGNSFAVKKFVKE